MVRDVGENCTVVGIPGRVIHQSGVRVNPLAHSALPDAEANVIRNLMERIDHLESQINSLQMTIRSIAGEKEMGSLVIGNSQSLKDKEIIEFLGDNE